MIDDNELVERIRARAYRLWEEDGRPEGREVEHWDKARILVAIEVDRTSLIPVAPDRSERCVQANLGDFPSAMTGEGDRGANTFAARTTRDPRERPFARDEEARPQDPEL